MTITVAVGTQNPAKLQAVQLAFAKLHPSTPILVTGYAVASGVSPQPLSPAESIQGARNRAQAALNRDPQASFGVGLEGGLEQVAGQWFDCGWCVIVGRSGQEGIASSARIPTPSLIMDMVHQGLELGEVIDLVFKTKNAKQAEGHFGLMTNRAVTRTDGYVQGVCLAFSRFLHPELFT